MAEHKPAPYRRASRLAFSTAASTAASSDRPDEHHTLPPGLWRQADYQTRAILHMLATYMLVASEQRSR